MGWDMQLIHVLFQKHKNYAGIYWLTRAVTGPAILEEILFGGNGSLTPTSSQARFYAARWIGWAGGKLSQDVPREHLDVKWQYT